jgi:hypothetical protein
MAYERTKRIINQPEVGDFKGNKTLSIPFGKENEAFSFGVVKAKAIIKYFAEITQFVAESDKEYEAKKAAQPQQKWS